MAKRLDVHNIRQFNKHGIRKIQRNSYELKEGTIRSGKKPGNFYVERAEWLYCQEAADRIILLSRETHEKNLEDLAEKILEKSREEWERAANDFLIREGKHTFKDNIEIIERKGEDEDVEIVQIDLVSNLYSTAEFYLSQINRNPDELPKKLVRILAGLYPKEWKERLPQSIPRYDPKDILQLLELMTSETALIDYFEFFNEFFKEKDWHIDEILNKLEALLETSTSFHAGLKDLHLVLRIIHKSLSLDSFSEISELKNEIDNYFLTIPNPEKYTDILYRQFHDLFDLLQKFQEETDFHDKLYFLEQSRKKIRESEGLVKARFVQPFRRLYSDILDSWMSITLEEGKSFSGKAFLEARLQTKRALWREKLPISLTIKNVGTGSAKNIEVSLHNSDEYEISDQRARQIDILHRNRNEDIKFYVEPKKEDSINLVFSVSHEDNGGFEFTDTLLFVRQEKFRRVPNPYNFTKPAEKSMFFGRGDLFAWIEENMEEPTVYQNVMIEGQRRTGKTSFLKRLYERTNSEHCCIFIDLELYQGVDDLTFLRTICEELHHSIPTSVSPPNLYEFVNKRYLAFKEYVNGLLSVTPKRIILVFDEFDKIASNIEDGLFKPGFLLFLRGVFQDSPRVSAIISGNFDIDKLNSREWKEFFTIFNPKKIGALEEGSAKELVTKPVKDFLQYDQYAMKKILDFSGRNPFYIQLLCYVLIKYINEKKKQNFIEAEDIDTAVMNEAKEIAEHVLGLTWDELSEMEKNVLFALAFQRNRYERSVELIVIQRHLRSRDIRVKRKELVRILDALIEKDIVTKSGGYPSFYDFSIALLRDWIVENGGS